MELSQNQNRILNASSNKSVIMASAASGKALAHGTKVYTNNGPKNIEDLKLCDRVFGDDGELHNILGIYPQGKKQEYIITFSDGNKIRCCKDHLWSFSYKKKCSKLRTWTTSDLYKRFFTKDEVLQTIYTPITKPVNFNKQPLLIHPYVMGAFLAAGDLEELSLCINDNNIIEKIIQDEDINLVKNKVEYYIYNNQESFIEKFKNYGLYGVNTYNKFIPKEYLYNTIDNRLELLKGLIDIRGSYKDSVYNLSLRSKQLALDVQELCESLGLVVTRQKIEVFAPMKYEKISSYGFLYRLNIVASEEIPQLCAVTSRMGNWKIKGKLVYRSIKSIEPTDNFVDMTCISVDNPTKLFLTEDFIVTHNTRLLTEKVRQILRAGVNPRMVAVITFTNMAASELKARLADDYKDGLYIGTIHGLANYMLCSGGVDTSSILNNEDFDKLFTLIQSNPQCVKHLEWLLLDEAQDSDPNQFKFLFEMIKPDYFFVVGDLKQSIYRWRNAEPQLLKDLSERSDVSTFELNENYRNKSNILQYAKRVIGLTGLYDNSIAMTTGGSVSEDYFSENFIVSKIRQNPSYKDWAILTRTNAELQDVCKILSKNNIPYDTFKQGDLNREQLLDKMDTNSVKVLTIHSAKGLEWDNVMVLGLKYYGIEEYNVGYVAITRARNNLYILKKPRNPYIKKRRF